MNLDVNASALQAQSVGVQVTSNNIVNSQTNEFNPSRTVYEERPDYGGVQVQSVQETSAVGGVESVINPVEVNGVMQQSQAMVQTSGTDLATEMVNLMQTETAYEANAAAIRTQDEMLGSFIDEMV